MSHRFALFLLGSQFILGPSVSANESAESHLDPSLPEGASMRLGSLRFRAPSDIVASALSPDGSILAVCCARGCIYLFNGETGKRIENRLGEWREWQNDDHLDYNLSNLLQFSLDGRRLFIAPDASQVSWRDIARPGMPPTTADVARDDPSLLAFSDGSWPAPHLMFSRRGQNSSENGIYLAAVRSGRSFFHLKIEDEPATSSAALSPDGRLLAVWKHRAAPDAGKPCLIEIWDVAAGALRHRLRADPIEGREVQFSSDGSLVATIGGSLIQVWNTGSGKLIREMTASSRQLVRLAISNDARKIAVAGSAGRIQLWDLGSGRRINCRPGPVEQLAGLQFAPDDRLLAWGFRGSAAFVWQPLEHSLNCQHTRAVGALLFRADGKQLLSASGDGQVIAWDARQGGGVKQLLAPSHGLDREQVDSLGVVFSPDARLMHFNEEVVDLSTGDAILHSNAMSCSPTNTLFSPHTHRLIMLEWPSDEKTTLPVWDLTTGALLHRNLIPDIQFTVAAVSPDGKMLAAAYSAGANPEQSQPEGVLIWDLIANKEARRISMAKPEIHGLAFTNDRQFVICSESEGSVWDAITGKCVQCYPLREIDLGRTTPFVVSSDGRLLAYVSIDRDRLAEIDPCPVCPEGLQLPQRIRVLEIASGSIRHEFDPGPGRVTSLAFSPDGGTLASGSSDTTILLWGLVDRRAAGPRPTPGELQRLWDSLARDEAKNAEPAMRRLTAHPNEAVPFLKRELRAVREIRSTPREIDRLIRDLDSDSYRVRDGAARQLQAIGAQALPAVEAALRERPGLDRQCRLESIRDLLQRPESAERWLRRIRSIELLERIATPEARQLLERMAAGRPDARPTQDARAALQRMTPR